MLCRAQTKIRPAYHFLSSFASTNLKYQPVRPFHSSSLRMAPQEVDRTIHDSATGAAYSLAQAHSAEKPLKLYAGWFCPFVQRTWITLNEKEIDYQYIEINPYHKSPDFLALNPRGLVPTLGVEVPTVVESNGDKPSDNNNTNGEGATTTTTPVRKLKPLYESIVIAEYLDEHYSNPSKYGPRLLPEGLNTHACYERARCRLWIDHISSRIVSKFYRVLQHTPESNYPLDDARQELLNGIKVFVKEMLEHDGEFEAMGESGPWFLGKSFGLVDISLAPWALRLFLIEHYKDGGVGIPEPGKGGKDEEVWKRWRTWFDAITARESVKSTMSEKQRYIDVYKRYAENETGSQVGQATRSGSGLP